MFVAGRFPASAPGPTDTAAIRQCAGGMRGKGGREPAPGDNVWADMLTTRENTGQEKGKTGQSPETEPDCGHNTHGV